MDEDVALILLSGFVALGILIIVYQVLNND